jgi:hypothetical protein
MSLNPRKMKTKNFEISGTQKDFDVLGDILEQAADRLNIDIYPGDYDIPGRILLRKQVSKDGTKATHWQYPKLSNALKAFAEGLRGEGDGTVNFESPQITDDPKDIVLDSPTLRMMNQTAAGTRLGVGQYIQEDIIADLTAMLAPTTIAARKQPLLSMNPTWVYAKNIVLDGSTPIGVVARDLETLAKVKNYPADLNKPSGFWKKVKAEGYNQAYFVIMRADKDVPLNMPLQSIPGEWDKWLKKRPVPRMLSLFVNSPPRTMGDYLERFAVYTTARTFGLKDAFLAPPFVGSSWDGRKIGSKKHFEDKILMTEPIKTRGGEYPTFYGFVVVGKGLTRKPDLGKERTSGALDLPGFET